MPLVDAIADDIATALGGAVGAVWSDSTDLDPAGRWLVSYNGSTSNSEDFADSRRRVISYIVTWVASGLVNDDAPAMDAEADVLALAGRGLWDELATATKALCLGASVWCDVAQAVVISPDPQRAEGVYQVQWPLTVTAYEATS